MIISSAPCLTTRMIGTTMMTTGRMDTTEVTADTTATTMGGKMYGLIEKLRILSA